MNLTLYQTDDQTSKYVNFVLFLILFFMGMSMGRFLGCLHDHLLCLIPTAEEASGTDMTRFSKFVIETFRLSYGRSLFSYKHSAWICASALSFIFIIVNFAIGILLIILTWRKYRYCHFLLAIGYAVNLFLFFVLLYALARPLFTTTVMLRGGTEFPTLGNPTVGDAMEKTTDVLSYAFFFLLTVFVLFGLKNKLKRR